MCRGGSREARLPWWRAQSKADARKAQRKASISKQHTTRLAAQADKEDARARRAAVAREVQRERRD
jgi:hypothetical protein